MNYPSVVLKTPADGFTAANNQQTDTHMSNANIPRRNSPEASALNDLLNTMNNPAIEGVVVPPGVSTKVVESPHFVVKPPAPPEDVIDKTSIPPVIDHALIEDTKSVLDPVLTGPRPPAYVARPGHDTVPQPPAPGRPPVSKLFFTGRLKSGKDYAATAAGAEIISFAAPLYAIASYYFHVEISATVGKDLPGVREFLQTIGQWGRGAVSEKYPLNVTRALFITRIVRGRPSNDFGFPEVDWATYGSNNNIWLDAALVRANKTLAASPGARVAITNCRFDHEFKRLQSDGFQHWHSLCSPKTWTARLLVEKLTPESPQVRDLSEQLAANLDANVVKQLSAQKNGPKLRAIWNDDAPCPSPRLHSVESFLQSLKGN